MSACTLDRHSIRAAIHRHVCGRADVNDVTAACLDTITECVGCSVKSIEEADVMFNAYCAEMKRNVRDNWQGVQDAKLNAMPVGGAA